MMLSGGFICIQVPVDPSIKELQVFFKWLYVYRRLRCIAKTGFMILSKVDFTLKVDFVFDTSM